MPRVVGLEEKEIPKFHSLWTQFEPVSKTKGELEEALAKHFGVSPRTIRGWMIRFPRPAPKWYEVAKDFLEIEHVKKWHEYLMTKFKHRFEKAQGIPYFAHALEAWEILNRKDPMLWTKEDILKLKTEYAVERPYMTGKTYEIEGWDTVRKRKIITRKAFPTKSYKPNTIEAKIVSIRQLFIGIGRVKETEEWDELGTEELGEETWHEPLLREEYDDLIKTIETVCPLHGFDRELCYEAKVICELKVMTGMRTGERLTGKDIFGLKMGKWAVSTKKGEMDATYVIIDPAYTEIITFHVLSKRNEEWYVKFFVPHIVEEFLEFLKRRGKKEGDFVFDIKHEKMMDIYNKALEILKEKHPRMKQFDWDLHNLRATFLTWMIESDVPLELGIKINVGWRDANTARDHYLRVRGEKYDEAWSKVLRKVWGGSL